MARKLPPPVPRVFISATSADLKSIRALVRDGLLAIDCQPVEQASFPPDYRDVREMLTAAIAECQAVIHIVGYCYGTEPTPSDLPPATQRQSYTQLEAAIARELNKKLFIFVCPENFPFDQPTVVETEELSRLQAEYRQQVLGNHSHLRNTFYTREDVPARIRELKKHLDETQKELERIRNRSSHLMVAFAVILLGLVLAAAAVLQRKPSPEVARAELVASLELGAKAAYQAQLAQASRAPNPEDGEKIRAAAEASYLASRSRINFVADNLIALQTAADATPDSIELSKLAGDKNAGVAEALKFLDERSPRIVAEVQADHQTARNKLQPLVQGAEMARNNGRNSTAADLYRKILQCDPGWTEVRHAYWNFLVDTEGLRARTYGQLEDARLIYLEAEHQARRLAEDMPTDPRGQSDLSATLLFLGEIAAKLGRLDETERCYMESLNIRQALQGTDPTNRTKFELELSASLISLGDLARERRVLDKASDYYERSLKIRKRLADADALPSYQMLLAVNFTCLGDIARERRDYPAAQAYYLAALERLDRVKNSESSNPQWRQATAVNHACLGGVFLETRSFTNAAENYQKAAKLRQGLYDEDSNSKERKCDLADSLRALGDLAQIVGRPGEATEHYLEVLRLRNELVTSDPASAIWKRNLAAAQSRAGDIFKERGKFDDAGKCYAAALELRDQMDHAGPEEQHELSAAQLSCGDLALAAGDLATAAENYTAAHSLRATLHASDRQSVRWANALAISLHCLGDLARASKDNQKAAEYFQGAADLVRASLPDRESRRLTGVSSMNLGEVAMQLGENDAARGHFLDALALRQALAGETPDSPELQRDLAVCLGRLGELAQACGSAAEAAKFYQRARTILDPVLAAFPQHPRYCTAMALLELQVANLAESRHDTNAATAASQRAYNLLRPIAGEVFFSAELKEQYARLSAHFAPSAQ
jgi:tetratricopeptide (TPR) repeat protein